MTGHATRTTSSAAINRVRTIVVVNGNATVLRLAERTLDAGRYEIVLLESRDVAYSQIVRLRPDAVILCARVDEPESCHLLTMLKLDPETRRIPILTYTTTGYEQLHAGAAPSTLAAFGDEDEEMVPARPALRMN